MSTAGRSRKPDAEGNTDSSRRQPDGPRGASDSRVSGQRQTQRVVAIPASALSSNQNPRGHSKPPAPHSAPAVRSSNRLASRQPSQATMAASSSAVTNNGPAVTVGNAWGTQGSLARKLSQQQQQQQPAQGSQGTVDRSEASSTVQGTEAALQHASSASQPSSSNDAAHPSGQSSPAGPLPAEEGDPGSAFGPHPGQPESSSRQPQPAARQVSAESQSQENAADRQGSVGSADQAPQRANRRRGSRGPSRERQLQQPAFQQNRAEVHEGADNDNAHMGRDTQQAPRPQPVEDRNLRQQPQQQPQQQQQQRRGHNQQQRERREEGMRQVPPVNLGRAAAEGASARPPSTPAASEPPRLFAGQVDQTPVGPGTPQERFPTPSTPTPATPHASEPTASQGPFGQVRPEASQTADASTASAPSDPSQPAPPSSQPSPNLPESLSGSETHPNPHQPDDGTSKRSLSSQPSGSSSGAPSSMKFTFGSFDPSVIGRPPSSQQASYAGQSQPPGHAFPGAFLAQPPPPGALPSAPNPAATKDLSEAQAGASAHQQTHDSATDAHPHSSADRSDEAAFQASAGSQTLPTDAAPDAASSSPQTDQAPGTAHAASASPQHGRLDSAPVVDSAKEPQAEGQRRRSQAGASGRAQDSRQNSFRQSQHRGQLPQDFYQQQQQWLHQQAYEQQYQQTGHWEGDRGYPGYHQGYQSGHDGTPGSTWYPEYSEHGMYDGSGRQFSGFPDWAQGQQAAYPYDAQYGYPTQAMPRPRGRGLNARQNQFNQYSHQQAGSNHRGPRQQQGPPHGLSGQQQFPQRAPGQQYMTHQVPGFQHLSHPGSQQGSQHGSQHVSPQQSPEGGGHRSISQDLPRSLSQSSEQAQPSRPHPQSFPHPGQPHWQNHANAPHYPHGGRQDPPAHPQAPHPSHPGGFANSAGPREGFAPAAGYGSQHPSMQTPFAAQPPLLQGQQGQSGAALQAQHQQLMYQQQLMHQRQPHPPQLQQPGPQLQVGSQQLQVPKLAGRQASAQSSSSSPHVQLHSQDQPQRQTQQSAQQRQQQQQQQQPLQQLAGQQQNKVPEQAAPDSRASGRMLSMEDAEAQMQGQGPSTSATTQQAPAGATGPGQAGQQPAGPKPTAPSQQPRPLPPAPQAAPAAQTSQAAAQPDTAQRSHQAATARSGSEGQQAPGAVPQRPDTGSETAPAQRGSVSQPPMPTPAPTPTSWAARLQQSSRPPSAQPPRPQLAQQQGQIQYQRPAVPQQAQQQAAGISAQQEQALLQPAQRSDEDEDPETAESGQKSSSEAAQAASLGLKAPSSLSTGAAVPSTKDAIFQQPSDSAPGQGQSAAAPGAATAAAKPAKASGSSQQPAKPAVAKRSLEGLDESVVTSIKALCQTETAQEGSEGGIRLQPRGLKNHGNLCFMNATLQALMAGSSFCAFVDALRAATSALPPADLPTLQAFSQLARAFPAQPQASPDADVPRGRAAAKQQNKADAEASQVRAPSKGPKSKPDAQEPQANAEGDVPQGRADTDQAQPQADSPAEPSSTPGLAPEGEEQSVTATDSNIASTGSRENLTANADSETEVEAKSAAQAETKSDGKAAAQADARADAKAAAKGSKPSSRTASSDGGTEPKSSKQAVKPAAAVKPQLELAGQAVVPDMMYKILDIFNPNNAKLLAATAAGQELTMAQKISRGIQKVAKQREQEDAQEFLTFLLDSAHQELLKLRAMYDTQDTAASTSYDENWEHVARKGKSNVTRGQEDVHGGRTLTSQIFGGAMQSTVKAARAKASVTVQPFNLLHLDIQGVNNVTAALQMLTKPEDIHDYKATDESVPVTAKKEIKLLRLPRILVLHMCRFTYTQRGLDKLHKAVQFPIKLKIQQSLLADECEQRRHGGADYELIASVSHHGKTPASGHYTADVKQPDGEWLRFDDDFVSHVNVPQVLKRDTEMYLLFYEMKTRT